MNLLTLSLGFKVRRMMSAASKSRFLLLLERNKLFFTISTTSFGFGVADAMYQGLSRREANQEMGKENRLYKITSHIAQISLCKLSQ